MENIRNFDVRLEMDNINAIKELVAHKIVDVLGCDGKAF